jgi:hypothetical protein
MTAVAAEMRQFIRLTITLEDTKGQGASGSVARTAPRTRKGISP